MPMYDKKAYKNPRLPRGQEVMAPGQQASAAPPRAGGLMQMAAQARARQPSRGQPPIPDTKAVRPSITPTRRPPGVAPAPSAAPPGMAPPPAAAPPVAPPTLAEAPELDRQRAAAAQQMMGAAPPLVPPVTDAQAMGAGPGLPGPTDPFGAVPGAGLDQQQVGIDATGKPVGLPGGPTGGLPPGGPGGGTYTPSSYVLGGEDDEGQGVAEEGAQTGDVDTGWQEEAPVEATEPVEPDPEEEPPKPEYESQTAEESFADYANKQGMQKMVDANGNQIGWLDGEGNGFNMQGQPAAGYDAQTAGEYKSENIKNQMESQLYDYLNQATGIPEEELQGQIAQLKMASTDQMAQFAQQMAARGVGASGLVGQGLGQIASQTVGAIANLRFENAKLALDERLNKMKAYMSMYGQMMSEENRMEIFDKMNGLEQTKFEYQQEQDRIESDWNVVSNIPAMLQAKGGWDSDAWTWAFKMVTEGKNEDGSPVTADQIMAELEVKEGKVVKKFKEPSEQGDDEGEKKYYAGDPKPSGEGIPTDKAIWDGHAMPTAAQDAWAKAQNFENYMQYLKFAEGAGQQYKG